MRLNLLKNFIKHKTPVWVYWLLRHLYRKLSPTIRREDRDEHLFMAELIQDGDLCFDIGCHLGRKARAMRECGAKVIGVEPEPTAQKMCTLEFRGDDNFILVPAGVAGSPGTMTLHRSSNLSQTSFLSEWADTDEQIEVEVTTLDRLISKFGPPVYCKIDVEGFEAKVFSGLTLPVPLISFEFHETETERAIKSLTYLKGLGASTSNVTPMDSTKFVFSKDIGIDEMIQFLTEDWKHGSRGDIYVKTPC